MKKIALLIAIASCTSPEDRRLFVCVHVLNSKCISVVRAGEVWR